MLIQSFIVIMICEYKLRIVQKIIGKVSDDSLQLKDFFGPHLKYFFLEGIPAIPSSLACGCGNGPPVHWPNASERGFAAGYDQAHAVGRSGTSVAQALYPLLRYRV